MHAKVKTKIPWTRYMVVLYFINGLIMIRSIYRVTEYVQGSNGFLQSNEVFIYIFDATLMFTCCLIFNLFHPSRILCLSHDADESGDLEILNSNGYKNLP